MEPRRSSDVDLPTLAIAAVASGVAAYLTSLVWEGGTLVSAALTPVIVALVKEALARPVDRVTTLRTREEPVAQTPLHPPVNVYGSPNRRWKVAVVSGIAAFLVVVAVFTVPELVAGKSIGRSGDSGTTLFGGSTRKESKARKRREERSKPTPAPGTEATATPAPSETATEEPTETPTPTPTVTVTPTPSPTAAATETPVP